MPSQEFEFLPDMPRRFARLVRVTDQNDDPWQPEELGAIWRHQLSAPVRFDFPEEGGRSVSPMDPNQGATREPELKLADLLHDARAPIELLKRAKEFAKGKRQQASKGYPKDIARVLYFASIVAALVRHRKRITRLTDSDILQGIEWALKQPWLDMETLRLFQEGKARLCRDNST
ncbi:MAG: hypothetical protein HY735_20815 [Verrucomicrobia bacterium]|nr:hypothetical protein [Verrucomicrobiota bacterium]